MRSLDSRTQPRFETYLEVEIDTGWVRSDGTVLSLSEGGLFARTEVPLMPGTRLHLSFQLPDESNVDLAGEVIYRSVRLAQAGVGVRFVRELRTEDAMSKLSRWCRGGSYLDEPDAARWSCVSTF